MANTAGVDPSPQHREASITLKTVTGDSTIIPFPAQGNLDALREAVLKAFNIPKHRQSLLVNNVPLVDNQKLERAIAQGEGNLTIVVLPRNPSVTRSVLLEEWFAENNIPEALKEALYEEGYDTDETIAELTEDALQSLCAKASITLTQGLRIKFRLLSDRLVKDSAAPSLEAMTALRLRAMQAAGRETTELRSLHSQGCITDKELEVNRRLILAKHGITPENEGDGMGAGADAKQPVEAPNRSNCHVVVADLGNHRLQVVNPIDGSFVRSIGNGPGNGPNQFRSPSGVTTLSNGHVVVVDRSNHRLQVVNPSDGSFVRSIGHGQGSGPNQFNFPIGVTTLPNGHVVVVDRNNHRLQVVNPIDGSFVRSIGNGPGSGPNQFNFPIGVTTLPNGHVVVGDYSNDRLQVVNPNDGSFLRSIGNGQGSGPNQFANPYGVATLPNGHVVVCDYGNHRLQVVNPNDGSFVRSIGNGQGSGPNQFNGPVAAVTLLSK
jgi:streptogramin lyase